MGSRRGRASKMGSRLTGLDFLGFGASWEPGVSDAAVAESVIRFLEDRRVLYDPHQVEMAEHCVESVVNIRGYITDVLTRGRIDSTLVDSMRAMRTACRTFLRRLRVNPEADIIEMARNYRHDNPYSNGMNDWVLNQAIGELRGVFGVHVALLAGRYGIDVEDDLASILPAEAE